MEKNVGTGIGEIWCSRGGGMYGGWRIWNSGAILKIKILAWCLLSAESKGFSIFTRVSAALSGRYARWKNWRNTQKRVLYENSVDLSRNGKRGGRKREEGRKNVAFNPTMHMYLYRVYAYVNSWKVTRPCKACTRFGAKDNIYWSCIREIKMSRQIKELQWKKLIKNIDTRIYLAR